MAINYKKCPKCKSEKTLKITYGEPMEDYFLENAKVVKFGGCCIQISGPEYYCEDCENEWNKSQAIDVAYSEITSIRASVVGFRRKSYEIEINFKDFAVYWTLTGLGNIETFQKDLTPSDVQKFVSRLKEVRLLNWKSKYIEPHLLDATEWQVKLYREGRTLNKSGNIQLPETWHAFCEGIEEITGREFR